MTTEQLQGIAEDLFRDLVEATPGPQDGAEVVLWLHVLLWKSQEGNTTAATMLDMFKAAFLDVIDEGAPLQ